jgi:CBS domain containing-hemolysin-like protein
MDTQFVAVPGDGTLDDFVQIASQRPDVSCFLVEGPEGFVGFLTRDSALRPPQHHQERATLAELADRRFISVREGTSLFEVMTRLRTANVRIALVTDGAANPSGDSVRGLITKEQIANAVIDSVELFSAEPDNDDQTANRREGGRSRSAGSPRSRRRALKDRVPARAEQQPSR